MQYRLPLRSGKLCPRWVPVRETVSPLDPITRTESQTTYNDPQRNQYVTCYSSVRINADDRRPRSMPEEQCA